MSSFSGGWIGSWACAGSTRRLWYHRLWYHHRDRLRTHNDRRLCGVPVGGAGGGGAHVFELRGGDGAGAIGIKLGEGPPDDLLLLELVDVHRRGDKLVVVDDAVAVDVGGGHDRRHLLRRNAVAPQLDGVLHGSTAPRVRCPGSSSGAIGAAVLVHRCPLRHDSLGAQLPRIKCVFVLM